MILTTVVELVHPCADVWHSQGTRSSSCDVSRLFECQAHVCPKVADARCSSSGTAAPLRHNQAMWRCFMVCLCRRIADGSLVLMPEQQRA